MGNNDSLVYQFAMELSDEAVTKAITAFKNNDMETFTKQAERSRYWKREAEHIAEEAFV